MAFAGFHLWGRLWPAGLDAYGAFHSTWVLRPLSTVAGWLPFSPGEWIAGAYLAWLLALTVRGGGAAARRRAPWGAVLSRGGARLVAHASALFLVFTLVWGFNYARPSVEERLGWPAWEGVGVQELEELSARLVAATDQAYLDLHGTDDSGTPTALEDWHALEAALDEAWAVQGPALLGEPGAALARGGGKRPLISPLLRRLGVAGMFFPFAAEAWVTRDLPAVVLSNTLAHEKAHQRGVTGEADASFLAVMVGGAASHPLARYAAAASAQLHVMAALRRADPEAWRELAEARSAGVRRDFRDRDAYWAAHRGPAREVRAAANDAYLRAHGVREGIGDYGRTVHLLVAWARLHGGRVLPD